MMKFRLILASLIPVVVSGWGGWRLGGSGGDPSSGATDPRFEPAVRQAPDLPPDGWEKRAAKQHSPFAEGSLAARAFADPGAAVAGVMSRPPGPERNEDMALLLQGWAARDPLAAAEWLSSLDPSETPEMPVAGIRRAFQSAPSEAKTKAVLGYLAVKASPSLLAQVSEGHVPSDGGLISDRDLANAARHLSGSFVDWVGLDQEAAFGWAKALTGPEARQWLMTEAVGALAQQGDAEAAIALYNSEPELHESGGVRTLGEGWAQADPAAALAWSAQLSDPELREAFLGAALRVMPAGQAAVALAYTSQISDLRQRQVLREHLLETARWHTASVRAWIENDPSLSAEERATCTAIIEAGAGASVRSPVRSR
jgi:hypothetical protein